MDINEKMKKIGQALNDIENMPLSNRNKKTYNKTGFIFDLEYTVNQLKYFFDTTVPSQTGMPNTSYYYLKKMEPKEHQVAYINLTRGFPKELFGAHYCYILKKFKDKYLVIPTTSSRGEGDVKQDFEIDIEIKNFVNDKITRLNVSNIRAIDPQRIYQFNDMFEKPKGIFDVITDRKIIVDQVKDILFSVHSQLTK